MLPNHGLTFWKGEIVSVSCAIQVDHKELCPGAYLYVLVGTSEEGVTSAGVLWTMETATQILQETQERRCIFGLVFPLEILQGMVEALSKTYKDMFAL